MVGLRAKLETAYKASGGKKVNIISHSMGGLLVRCFMSMNHDVSFLVWHTTLGYATKIRLSNHPFSFPSRYFQSMSINGFALLVHFKVMHFQPTEDLCHCWPLIEYTSYISSHILAGAPGCINDSLLTGLQFVYGFESFFFVSRWAMHQLVISWPCCN
jgi:hypothetical protein